MHILAFGHRKRTGKDTCANFAKTFLLTKSRNTVKDNFAWELKMMAYRLYKHLGMKEPAYYDENPEDRNKVLPKIEKTVRQVWIELGMKLREIYSDTWVDYLIEIYKNYIDYLIIPDLRFPNEVEKIRQYSSTLVKVVNPRIPDTDDIADCSLKDYKDWDYIINNDGDLDKLQEMVGQLCQTIS